MRQVITVLFICSLSVPFLGVFGWLSVEKYKLRKKVKHTIMEHVSNDELVSFTFKISDTSKLLRWEHDREFEYEGEMYDVVRRVYNYDQVTYHLWWDSKETELNQKLDNLTAALMNNSPSKERSTQQLSLFVSNLFLEELPCMEYPEIFEETTDKFYFSNSYISNCLSIPSPPPRSLRTL